MLLLDVLWKARGKPALCDSDTDCQDGFSCQEHICKSCVKCGLLFRKGSTCVSDFNDCGECLKGYEEILVTDFSKVVKPCKPVKKNVTTKCIKDDDCPLNAYCSEESCIECFDCNSINRLQSSENCTKGQVMCGPCFNGFVVDPDAVESKGACEEDINFLLNLHKQPVQENLYLDFALAILTVICLLIFLKCLFKNDERESSVPSECCTTHSSRDNVLRFLSISLTRSSDQPIETIAYSSDSSGRKSDVDASDAAQEPEAVATESTDGLPQNQNAGLNLWVKFKRLVVQSLHH